LDPYEGQAYLDVGGWAAVPNCGSPNNPTCWTQDIAFCERDFCKVLIPQGANYGIPLEENADFVGRWYNPAKITDWGIDAFTRAAPRRAAWARMWLP